MSSLDPLMQTPQNALKFHLEYTKTHLFWIQFLKHHISLTPNLIFVFGDRVLCFFEKKDFDQAKRRWHGYISKPHRRITHHFRILLYSENLATLIKNWYYNIKKLKVEVNFENNCYNIDLYPPKNLRQFIIGKNGAELEMLANFLDSCISGGYNYHLILH